MGKTDMLIGQIYEWKIFHFLFSVFYTFIFFNAICFFFLLFFFSVVFQFKSSKKSNNGTDVNAGQIPQLLYRQATLSLQ